MSTQNAHWLAGFAMVLVECVDGLVRFRLKFFLDTVARHFVSIRLMDPEGLEVIGIDGQPVFKFMTELPATGKAREPKGAEFHQAGVWFDDRKLRQSVIEIAVPEFLLKKQTSIGIDIGGRCCQAGRHGQSHFCGDSVHLDVNVEKASNSLEGVLFLLITRSEGGRRVEQIARSRGYFELDDERTSELVSNLACEIFGGGDGPLLTDDLT